MAFENVFGNIDFMAPVRSEWQQAQNFQQMLGQGLEVGLKRRQLENERLKLEAEANKPIDVTKVGQNALLKLEQGIPLNAQEQAAAQFLLKTDVPRQIYNQETMQMETIPQQYGAYRNLLGAGLGSVSPTVQTAPTNIFSGAKSEAGAIGGSYGGQTVGGDNIDYSAYMTPQQAKQRQEAMARNAGMVGGGMPAPMNEQDIVNVLEGETYKAPAEFGMRGRLMEEESKQKAKDAQYAKELSFKETREEKRIAAIRPLFEPLEGYEPSNEDVKSMTKMTVSSNVLKSLIKDYKSAVKKYGVSVKGSEGAKKIDQIGGQIRMQVKNLEELGALQEPDVKAMNEMLGQAVLSIGDVKNPVSGFTQIRKGDKIATEAMDIFESYIDKTLSENANARGFKLKQEESKTKPPLTREQALFLAKKRGLIK